MKKSLLCMIAVVFCMAARAAAPQRKMLEQGKTWAYVYHHIDDTPEGSQWMVYYTLEGDTIINELQYMKMYRYDENDGKKIYYGAFREDEEGRVWVYERHYKAEDKAEYLIIDFNIENLWLNYNKHFGDLYGENPLDIDATIVENIKENGHYFRRYRYARSFSNNITDNWFYVGVEGVGFQGNGIQHHIFEPIPTCICDSESLAYVIGSDFWFNASAFNAPKEIELTDGERQLIASNNDFAFNLFRKARGEESKVLSPLSITYALGMLNNGAAGQTQQEISQTLGFGEAGADAINAFCQKMLKEAETLDEKTKSLIANTIFVNEGLGYRLQDDFVKKANDYYDAQPQDRDFGDGETMDVINQWASDHTEGMIPKVLDEITFNPLAVSYLLNALYFKGAWSDPFDKAETKDEPFGGGETVPMMHKPYTEFKYTENNLYQAVNLPYGNGAYQMSVFLPREGKTIGDVLDALNGSNWQVTALGMPTAFTSGAYFPYFCNAPVFISNMFQAAKIKLDEQGTEAAAVTTVVSGATSITPTAEFHANRPFLYIISEQSTGVIFFIGQYMGEITTAIVSPRIQDLTEDDAIYNLSGQKVNGSYKGLVIQNGKKKLVK